MAPSRLQANADPLTYHLTYRYSKEGLDKMFAPLHLPSLGKRLERCSFDGCGALVHPSAMADHWITAYHYLRAINGGGIRVRDGAS